MNITASPNYQHPEDIKPFDVIRVPLNGMVNKVTVVVMDHMLDMDRHLASYDVFPVDVIPNMAVIDRATSFGITSDKYKLQMGLPLDRDFKISFVPIRLKVRDVDLIERIGHVGMRNVQQVAGNEFMERAILERKGGSHVLDRSTSGKLQSGRNFAPQTPVFTVSPIVAKSSRDVLKDTDLPVFLPPQIDKDKTEPKAEEVFKPVATTVSPQVEREDPSLGTLTERGQLSEYTRNIFSGFSKDADPDPVMDKKGVPLVDENGKPILVRTASDIFRLVNAIGGPENLAKIEFIGPKTAAQAAAEIENLRKLYPQ